MTGRSFAELCRADLHCHSTASQEPTLGVQRATGAPACATPPEEVYEPVERRGMDFATIADHDTISGVLQIAERPDVFVSEEPAAQFRGEPQAVHVLCFGITVDDHERLQANRGRVELCAGAGELRGRPARAGLAAVRERTWERALQRLDAGCRQLLRARERERLARAA